MILSGLQRLFSFSKLAKLYMRLMLGDKMVKIMMVMDMVMIKDGDGDGCGDRRMIGLPDFEPSSSC